MKTKVTVQLMDGTEEVYEAEYPQSHVSLQEGPQGWKVVQEAREPPKRPIFDGDDSVWNAKSWSTVHYPTHAVKRITSTQW